MIEPRYKSDKVELYLGDCLEILPQLEPGSVDAVVTDPPYGINLQPQTRHGWNGKQHGRYSPIIGDDSKFDPKPFMIYPLVVIFGANYFSDQLPVGGWIIWDKTLGKYLGTSPEIAWCNKPGLKIIRVLHNGVINADSVYGNNEPRYHPTQKPVALIKEILVDYPNAATILDPFMGSGTTGVACMQTGRKFIGIEIDPTYYAIAEKRIRQAEAQLLLGI